MFAGVFFQTQKNCLCGAFKVIFFLSQQTFVHTSSELAAPVPSSCWKIGCFSCYFSRVAVFLFSFFFLSVLLKALRKSQHSHISTELRGSPMNPGIVLLAKESNTLQRKQSLHLPYQFCWLPIAAHRSFIFPLSPSHFPRAVGCPSPECHH